jgi:hypothetical protein
MSGAAPMAGQRTVAGWRATLATTLVLYAFIPAWAQGVAGSNPVAPTTSHENLHNTNEERELADYSATLAICPTWPRIATFCIGVGPNLGPQESQLSDANVGGYAFAKATADRCRRRAAKNGHTRLGETTHCKNDQRGDRRARRARRETYVVSGFSRTGSKRLVRTKFAPRWPDDRAIAIRDAN